MPGTDETILQDDKIIHNPVTGSEYKVRDHSSKYGIKKDLKGLWQDQKKNPLKNIDEKGSILPDLRLPHIIYPTKRGCFVHKCLDRCRSVSRTTLEKFGACFGMIGAVFVALPATVAYTFATNAMFLVGDIFLLTLFLRDGRNWLIVQYSVFGVLAFWGVCNNLPGVLL